MISSVLAGGHQRPHRVHERTGAVERHVDVLQPAPDIDQVIEREHASLQWLFVTSSKDECRPDFLRPCGGQTHGVAGAS
nr:hypothetical protein [uncultured Pseudoxanthomonas sp.]